MTSEGRVPDSYWVALALAGVVLFVWNRALGAEFNPIDDTQYVVRNELVQTGFSVDTVVSAFTTFRESNWHPLTWLSLMLDRALFGPGPFGFHLTNVLLHAVSTGLLFVTLQRLTGEAGRSLFVAALFGVHPQHTESVAWIAERKDTLSTLFWILTLFCYERRQRTGGRWWGGVAYLCFALGLMSKQMLVTLPCVLVLLDHWPLQRVSPETFTSLTSYAKRLGGLILEKWPYWLMVLAAAVLTYAAQAAGGSVGSLAMLPMSRRIANALVSFVAYIGLTLYPVPLSVIYPYDVLEVGAIGPWLAALVLVGITILAGRRALTDAGPLVGWLWYLGTLVPVIGLVQVGAQAFANRYVYVPHIGLFLAVAWSVPRQSTWQPVAKWVGVTAVVICAALTHWQLGFWKTGETLMVRCLDVTQRNPVVRDALGIWYDEHRRPEEALFQLRKAVEEAPAFVDGWQQLTLFHIRRGDLPAAERAATEWTRVEPNSAIPFTKLAQVRLELGNGTGAWSALSQAEPLPGRTAEFHLTRAWLRTGPEQADEARRDLLEAIRLDPRLAAAHYELGTVEARSGRPREAEQRFREAVRLKPDQPVLRFALARHLAETGQREEALGEARKILASNPGFAPAIELLKALGGQPSR